MATVHLGDYLPSCKLHERKDPSSLRLEIRTLRQTQREGRGGKDGGGNKESDASKIRSNEIQRLGTRAGSQDVPRCQEDALEKGISVGLWQTSGNPSVQ